MLEPHNKPVDAIFFDFDGVIVDSVELKVEAFRDMYKDYGPDVVDAVEAYQRYHGGMARRYKFIHFEEEILGRKRDDASIEKLCQTYSDLVEEKVVNTAYLPGALEFLEAYSSEIPFFIISGTPEPELQRITNRRNITAHFSEVRGSPISKDDAIRHFLSVGPFQPPRTVMVGDAITDHDAAKVTNVPFVGIAPDGVKHFFPDGTTIISDMRHLAEAIGLS